MSEQLTPNEADGEQGDLQVANTFDLRRIIGGLFLIYGVVLVIVGLGDSGKDITKAAGVHINLYAGGGMLVFAALMLAWGFLRPLADQLAEADEA